MAVMPRQNLIQIVARVRELTGIFSTDVYADARIKKLVNETLYNIIKIADDMLTYLYDLNAGANYGKPILVARTNAQTGTTTNYRFPGWRFDTPTNAPTDLLTNVYMSLDTDLAPWIGNVGNTGMGGYYDNILVYKVASDMLREIGDDSNRAEFFSNKFDEILQVLIRDEFIEWNFALAESILATDLNYHNAVALKVLRNLNRIVNVDNLPSLTYRCVIAVNNSKNEFYYAYTWPFANTWSNFGTPYPFVYEASAKVAVEYDVPEATIKGWLAEAESQKSMLVRNFITNNYGSSFPSTLVDMKKQVRALLSDFSKDLPEQIIISWINEAYQILALEKNWAWLEVEALYQVSAGSVGFQLDNIGSRKILDMYVVEQKGAYSGSSVASDTVDIVSQVPHIQDGKINDSQYHYDVNATGFVTLSPAPLTKAIKLKIKYLSRCPGLSADSDEVLFNDEFAGILVYRAAMKGVMLNPSGKKLYEVYDMAQQTLFKAMVNFYQLDHSTEPFQIGAKGYEERKYIPFFKVG